MRRTCIVLLAAALAAMLTTACGLRTAPPPVTPEPGPPPVAFARAAMTVLDASRATIPGLTCKMTPDTLEGESTIDPLFCEYNGLQATFSMPERLFGRGADLELAAPGFASISTRLVTSPDLPEQTLRLAALQAGESGWLRRQGSTIVTESGEVWQWRGATSFWLLKRLCDGESVEGYLNDPNGPIATGANILRVLGMFNGGLGRFIPAEYPNYDGCVRQLVQVANAHSVRVEFVVFADAQAIPQFASDTTAQKNWLTRIAGLIDDPMLVGELVNEYPKNGIAPEGFAKPGTRILWSRGSGLGDGDPALPAWDFLTHHSARVDEWPRRIECREYTNNANSPALGTPCVEDEPYGAAEVRFPGRRVGLEALEDMRQWGAVCGMHAAGCTFHSDGGIFSQGWGPVQLQLAQAFFAAMKWVPPPAQTWAYQRGERDGGAGVGNMPLEHTDALALRTWCKTSGGQSWCVAVRPAAGWSARARAGWRVVNEPARGLIYLER